MPSGPIASDAFRPLSRRVARAALLVAAVLLLPISAAAGTSAQVGFGGNSVPGAFELPGGTGDPLVVGAAETAPTQDRASVPPNLVPSLARAAQDLGPSYHDGCHTRLGSPTIHPCVYGNHAGTMTIALFGDSHAAQWLPALIRAAGTRPWRIVSLTHSSCPSAQVNAVQLSRTNAAACTTWRKRAVAWLRSHPPDVVLLANLSTYALLDATGRPIPAAKRENAWKLGLEQTLRQMPGSAGLLVLADTPSNRVNVPVCLNTHMTQVSACQTPRSRAINAQHNRAELAAATQVGATFASMDGVVCWRDPCPVIDGHVLMYRDPGHLTATYSRQLGPSLAVIVERVIPPGP